MTSLWLPDSFDAVAPPLLHGFLIQCCVLFSPSFFPLDVWRHSVGLGRGGPGAWTDDVMVVVGSGADTTHLLRMFVVVSGLAA